MLEYWRRVRKHEIKAAKGQLSNYLDDEDDSDEFEPYQPPTEQEAEQQFHAAQAFMPVGGRIPEHFRDAIRWAEEELSKRKGKLVANG